MPPDFSEEEVTAAADVLEAMDGQDLSTVARAVLEASGAVPRAEYEKLRDALELIASGRIEGPENEWAARAVRVARAALSRPDTTDDR